MLRGLAGTGIRGNPAESCDGTGIVAGMHGNPADTKYLVLASSGCRIRNPCEEGHQPQLPKGAKHAYSNAGWSETNAKSLFVADAKD